MKNFLHSVFIKSWKTTLTGAAVVVGGVTQLPIISDTANQIVANNPQNKSQWIQTLLQIGLGVGLMFAKDADKTGGAK